VICWLNLPAALLVSVVELLVEVVASLSLLGLGNRWDLLLV